LMNQYQSQNQPDMAVQIARQLLRKGPNVQNMGPYRNYSEDDNARPQAIQVLARSRKLTEMIERAEAQLKSSPKAIAVHQTLIDYYRAAGDKEKLKAAVVKMAEIKPDDGKVRFTVAQTLNEMGEFDAAIEQYRIGMKKEPALFANYYWEIQNAFARANK